VRNIGQPDAADSDAGTAALTILHDLKLILPTPQY
jgi:hypothetical protein